MVKNESVALWLILLFFVSNSSFSQNATYQRLGREQQDDLDLTLGFGLSVSRSDSDYSTGIKCNPLLTVDLLYQKHFGFSFEFPYVAWISLKHNAIPAAIGSVGDPRFAVSYSLRLADWRLGTDLFYSHPLGIWNIYEAQEKKIVTGVGYPRLGSSISAIRYLDPIIAGVRISEETCFARSEQIGKVTKPLILTFDLFTAEALNDVVAFSINISNKLSWPRYVNGSPSEADLVYSLFGNLSLIFSEASHGIKIGVSKLLSDDKSPATFDFSISFTLHKKEKKNNAM